MGDLFGGALTITDNFSSTFSKFTGSLSSIGSSFSNFTNNIGIAERNNRVSLQNMKNEMKRYTDFYVSQGYTMKQAMGKATSSLTDNAPASTGNKWADAFGKIKQSGVDAFEGIGQKMQDFSNSTLGMVTKITAGYLSLKGATELLKTGMGTGMEYQNLRLVMDNLYQSKDKGGQQFTMATNFAANSIWQERDVARSLAMLKGYGLKDDESELKKMSDLGSFEKAMGRGDINTATQAYSEMLQGRWYMAQMGFGIKREDVEKYAKSNGMKTFDDKNGHVTDVNALEDAFGAYMKSRGLTGLSDKLANTATGKLSTFMDNFTKSLADLVGITNSGEVKNGSLFDNFVKGIGNFTNKIKDFSTSTQFEELSSGISKLGSSIYNGFSFILDHPELAGDILKLGVALFAIGKIGALASAITSIGTVASSIGKLFVEGGILAEGGSLAGLGSVITGLVLPLAATVGGLMLLSSALSPNGLLNQGIGWLLGELFGDDVKKGWQEDTEDMANFFQKAKEGWLMLLGLANPNSTTNNDNVDASKLTYYDKNGAVTDNSNIHFYTADEMLKNGQIQKSTDNMNTNVNHNYNVNMNIGKVEKTADIDEVMDTVTTRLDKYSNTRNNLQ